MHLRIRGEASDEGGGDEYDGRDEDVDDDGDSEGTHVDDDEHDDRHERLQDDIGQAGRQHRPAVRHHAVIGVTPVPRQQ